MTATATRREEWADAVFHAVAALRRVIDDAAAGPALVVRAAGEIVKLEVARMRHGTAVSGTAEPAADDLALLRDLLPAGGPAADEDALDLVGQAFLPARAARGRQECLPHQPAGPADALRMPPDGGPDDLGALLGD